MIVQFSDKSSEAKKGIGKVLTIWYMKCNELTIISEDVGHILNDRIV